MEAYCITEHLLEIYI